MIIRSLRFFHGPLLLCTCIIKSFCCLYNDKHDSISTNRFPVILRRFHLNDGTGGRGLYRGGDGVLRELMFRQSLTLCVLSERRVYAPYGLCG